MGSHPNIGITKFPDQGTFLNKRVSVCFDYDTSLQIHGTVVREDLEEPGRMIIQLDDGRYVLAIECQYHMLREG